MVEKVGEDLDRAKVTRYQAGLWRERLRVAGDHLEEVTPCLQTILVVIDVPISRTTSCSGKCALEGPELGHGTAPLLGVYRGRYPGHFGLPQIPCLLTHRSHKLIRDTSNPCVRCRCCNRAYCAQPGHRSAQVQRLGHRASRAGGMGSIPCRELHQSMQNGWRQDLPKATTPLSVDSVS